jgi:hypothetical protein
MATSRKKAISRKKRETTSEPSHVEPIRPERIIARQRQALEEIVGRLGKFNWALQQGQLPEIRIGNQKLVDQTSEMLTATVGRLETASQAAIQDVETLFETELASTDLPPRQKEQIRLQLRTRFSWAQKLIKECADSARTLIAQARNWATTFTREQPAIGFLPLPLEIQRVWRSFQFHGIGGVPVPLAKEKYHIKILGFELNFGLVNFPSLPGWNPPPKVLPPSGTTVVGGRTITALDSIGVHTGNPVLPAAAPLPATNLFGYMKFIYVTGVAAACTISFRTVLYPRVFLLLPGAAAWVDISPGGAGTPQADPPGGGPNINVGGGGWVFADFPNTGPGGFAAPTHIFRNELYRTWVVELCPPAAPNVLGYYEWGFRQLVHVTAPGVMANVIVPPAPGGLPVPPAGASPPGGGWPANVPSTTPVTWTNAGAAPAAATADYNAAFP